MKDASNLRLLVGILNKYVYYYGRGHERITAFDVNNLIGLINEYITTFRSEGKAPDAHNAVTFFENTLEAIKVKQSRPETQTRFAEIQP